MDNNVVVVGYGMVRVGEYWYKDIVSIGVEAAESALEAAGNPDIDAFYVGSALSSALGIQGNVGLHIADEIGLDDFIVETISSGGVSSGLAFINGLHYLASRHGYVLVGGVEKTSDNLPTEVSEAVLVDLDRRVMKYSGLTEAGLAAILARLYMERYGVDRSKITQISVLDHENAVDNPYAMFRKAVTLDMALSSPIVADPLTIFDVSPYGDGAAFLVLTTKDRAIEDGLRYVEVAGYGFARNRVPINYREDILSFRATAKAVGDALGSAGISLDDLDIIELFDSYSISGLLALEGIGVCESGSSANEFSRGMFRRGMRPSINTFGGLKARGYPIGATTAYQISEAVIRLLSDSDDYSTALIHSMTGFDDEALAIILRRGGLNA